MIANLYDEGLPPAYDQGVFDEKVERTYQWVFEKFPGECAEDKANMAPGRDGSLVAQ